MPIWDTTSAGTSTAIDKLWDVTAAGTSSQIGSVWDVTAAGTNSKIYDAEFWIYNNGDIPSVTGGWTVMPCFGTVTYPSTVGSGDLGTQVLIQGKGDTAWYATCITAAAISFAGYSTLYWRCAGIVTHGLSDAYRGLIVSLTNAWNFASSNVVARSEARAAGIYTLDISGLNGSYCVGIINNNQSFSSGTYQTFADQIWMT